jgi:hypothetical protein
VFTEMGLCSAIDGDLKSKDDQHLGIYKKRVWKRKIGTTLAQLGQKQEDICDARRDDRLNVQMFSYTHVMLWAW